MEKLIEEPRHIEIQVVGDSKGKACHLSERDCSIQRRHQKLTEEVPSPFMTDKLREKMGAAAVKAAEYIKYEGVGTVEFLVDKNRKFYFMEMNTRIQVEHTVSEEVTGIDLLKEQIKVAAGEKLSFSQEDVNVCGHAIEFRVNAEDPYNNFTPAPGPVEAVHFPGGPGIRIDSHVYSGYFISPHYDSMIGKIIAKGVNREESINRLKRALQEFTIEGPNTTVPLGESLMDNKKFKEGSYNTAYLEVFMDEVFLKEK